MLFLGMALWVFLALLALGIAVIVAVEKEEPFGALIALIAAGAVAHFSGTVNMLDVLHNWQHLLLFLGAYIGIGVGWCAIKWAFFTAAWGKEQREKVQDNRGRFLERMGIKGDSIPAEHKVAWEKWLKGGWPLHTDLSDPANKPYEMLRGLDVDRIGTSNDIHIRNNWKRFSIWCIYWPFSVLWTLIDDPIKAIFKFLVLHVLGGALQSFANRAASGVEKEINK